MIICVPGRTPETRNTKLTTPTFIVVVGAIYFAPGARATRLDTPSFGFCGCQGRFHCRFWVPLPWHMIVSGSDRDNKNNASGCQLTTSCTYRLYSPHIIPVFASRSAAKSQHIRAIFLRIETSSNRESDTGRPQLPGVLARPRKLRSVQPQRTPQRLQIRVERLRCF